MPSEDKNQCPWILDSLKPIQLSHFDRDLFLNARKQFTTGEWIDLLLQSIGFQPSLFGERSKLFQLMRLVPYCERNYNLIELGPKGTGKSHIYSEFSPHGILLSGGEVTVPKLFVNNSNGRLGLVGYWDAIAFDEFAGREKKPDKKLVDIMKNYMANKSFSRGVETLSAEASMIFVGNTQHSVPYMLKNTDLGDYVSQVLIPTEKTYTVRNGKKVMKERAYLPGYVLVEATLVGEVAHRLCNIPNVIGFLGGSETPVPLRPAEVSRILGTVDELQGQTGDLDVQFYVGESVKITFGPFSGFTGIIEEVNAEKKKLKVMVKVFGRKTPLELGYMQVEKE